MTRTTTLCLVVILAGCGGVGQTGEPGETTYGPMANGSYAALAINGSPTATPAHLQADLNIKLRGLTPVNEARHLVSINGPTDGKAPKINTTFGDNRVPGMQQVYKVGKFGGLGQGVEGGYSVHVVEFVTTPGEMIRTPRSGYDIGQGMTALVLHADGDSLTLKYTREDNIVHGYAIHLLGIVVDPALKSLYDGCVAQGRHTLPAVSNGQALGVASGSLRVSVRDTGQFMDPRSDKDWYDGSGTVEPTPPAGSPANPPPVNPPPANPPPANPPPANPPPANPPPANPPKQTTDCSASGVHFALDQTPVACGQVAVTVTTGQAHTWVLAGIKAPASGVHWTGGATQVGCDGGGCHWTFSLQVPCQPGPFTLHFMEGATGDDPNQGAQLAFCQP